MVPLGAQVVGVLLAALLVTGLARRAGVRATVPAGAVLTALVFLTVLGAGSLREGWRDLDRQRADNDHLSADAARQENCVRLGVDPAAVAWVSGRMPQRARFYLAPGSSLNPGADICLRFLLLPRLQVNGVAEADHVLFWNARARSGLLSDLRGRGAPVVSFGDAYHLAGID